MLDVQHPVLADTKPQVSVALPATADALGTWRKYFDCQY